MAMYTFFEEKGDVVTFTGRKVVSKCAMIKNLYHVALAAF
jgi:hypothetical protein